MSESYPGGAAGTSGADSQKPSGTVETAKQELGDVKDTVTQEAGSVMDTAKSEATAVAHEAKSQVKDLYAQSRSELKEQASIQQDRVAEGLRSVGDELRSMVDNSESGGVGADLVRQTSTKVSSVAEWLGDRDPGSLLNEVKSYARRKPGVFIAVAALAGLAAGRLTRALSENAADEHSSGPSASAGSGAARRATASPTVPAAPPAPTSPGMPAAPPAPGSGVTASGGVANPPMGGPVDADIPLAPDGLPGNSAVSPPPAVGKDTPVFDRTDSTGFDPLRGERP